MLLMIRMSLHLFLLLDLLCFCGGLETPFSSVFFEDSLTLCTSLRALHDFVCIPHFFSAVESRLNSTFSKYIESSLCSNLKWATTS